MSYLQAFDETGIPKTTLCGWVLKGRKFWEKTTGGDLTPTGSPSPETSVDGGDSVTGPATPDTTVTEPQSDNQTLGVVTLGTIATNGDIEGSSSVKSPASDESKSVRVKLTLGVRKKITKRKQHPFSRRGRRPKIVRNDLVPVDGLMSTTGDPVVPGATSASTSAAIGDSEVSDGQLAGEREVPSTAAFEETMEVVSGETSVSSDIVPVTKLPGIGKKIRHRGDAPKRSGPGRPRRNPSDAVKRKPFKRRGRRPKIVPKGLSAEDLVQTLLEPSVLGEATNSQSVTPVDNDPSVPGGDGQMVGILALPAEAIPEEPTQVVTNQLAVTSDTLPVKRKPGVRKKKTAKFRAHALSRPGPGRPRQDALGNNIGKRKAGRPKGSKNKTTLAKLDLGHNSGFLVKYSPRRLPQTGFFTEAENDHLLADNLSKDEQLPNGIINGPSRVQPLPLRQPVCSNDTREMFNGTYETNRCEFQLGVFDSDDDALEITTHQALAYCELLLTRAQQQGEDSLVAELQNLRKILSDQLDSLMRHQTKITDYFSKNVQARWLHVTWLSSLRNGCGIM